MENQRPLPVAIGSVKQDQCCVVPISTRVLALLDKARDLVRQHPSYAAEVYEDAVNKTRELLREGLRIEQHRGDVVKRAFFESAMDYIQDNIPADRMLGAEAVEKLFTLMPDTLCARTVIILYDTKDLPHEGT